MTDTERRDDLATEAPIAFAVRFGELLDSAKYADADPSDERDGVVVLKRPTVFEVEGFRRVLDSLPLLWSEHESVGGENRFSLVEQGRRGGDR